MEVLWMVYGTIDAEPAVMVFELEQDALAVMANILEARGGECASTRLRCSTVTGVTLLEFDMGDAMKLGWKRALVEA